MFSNEVQKLHEYIKEYLRFAKFDDTYECFDAEINTKIVSKKLDDPEIDFMSEQTPELFRMMKGVSVNSLMNHKRQQQLEDINEKYLDLLTGARQIYSLTIRMRQICEEDKSISKSNAKLLDKVKDAMVRYHRLILPEEEDTVAPPMDNKEMKKRAKLLKQHCEKADSNTEVYKILTEIRANGLTIDPNNRRRWINDLVDADIFSLKENMNILNHLVHKSNGRIQTVATGVLSMVASSETGIAYLTKPTDSLRKYCEILTNIPELSVSNRFGLATLYKFSCYDDFPSIMLDNNIERYVESFMAGYKPKSCHSYFPIFYTALAYQILTSPSSQEKVSRFVNKYSPFCKKLLEFFKKDLPSAAHQNILEIFKYFNQDKAVYFKDLMVECDGPETLSKYYSQLQTIFAGRDHILDIHLNQFSQTIKQTLAPPPTLTKKEELEKRKKEKQLEDEKKSKVKPVRKLHDFEAFKDEILDDAL